MDNHLFILSLESEKDIDAIFSYSEHKFGNTQAVIYLIGLQKKFKLIATNPTIGKQRNEIKEGLFSLPYSSHIIFYRILKNHIQIIRVLYGGRDLIKFLK